MFKKKYRRNNKEKLSILNSEYYKTNKEQIDAQHKEYYENNKQKIVVHQNEYYKNNKEIIDNYRREYYKDRNQNDPSFKLRRRVSNQVWFFLIKNGSSKNKESILNYLPYSIQELKLHLEKQFELWMNWDNYGSYQISKWNDNDSNTWTWQIDHIVPHSKFHYTSMEDQEFEDCWALNNLRPYSSKQNLLDSDRG